MFHKDFFTLLIAKIQTLPLKFPCYDEKIDCKSSRISWMARVTGVTVARGIGIRRA